MGKRPHIIIFNPDEMRADSLSHLGNPASLTPNLDAFALNDAVSFSQAYCQNPVCVPSRCSFFTGTYPHVRGHRTMEYLLQPGEDSLFSELRKNGYYVWMNARNDLLAGEFKGFAESHADEIFYGGDVPPVPGPEDLHFRGDIGDKSFYSHFHGRLKTDESGRNYTYDDETVDAAIRRILDPPDDRPMCLFLGLNYPHVPYAVEEPYYSAVNRDKLPKRIRWEDCSDKAKILARIHELVNMDQYDEKEWNELRAVYLGMCMKVDAQFGRLVAALKQAGIYDDCAIFFLSDHGDFTGDYGLVEKAQNSFEDCLTRVPLLIKPPKSIDMEPGICDSLTELVDFYATVMDVSGTKPSHTHFGKSLIPLLKDHNIAQREYVFCEGGRTASEIHCDEYHSYAAMSNIENLEYWPKMMAQTDPECHAKGIMMRSKEFKYISRIYGEDEFYDLTKDPEEKINRIHDPSYGDKILDMQKKMLKWLQGTADIVPFKHDSRWTSEMMFYKVKNGVPREKWDRLREMAESGADMFTMRKFAEQLRKEG